MIIIIFTIILIMVIIREIYKDYEPFKDLNLYTAYMYGAPKHARLNQCNKVESIHLEPPTPKVGESRCDDVLCPPYYSDFVTCYKCI